MIYQEKISFDGKVWYQIEWENIDFHTFDNLEDAVKVRQKAEEEYFGQYRYIDKVVSKYEEEM